MFVWRFFEKLFVQEVVDLEMRSEEILYKGLLKFQPIASLVLKRGNEDQVKPIKH
jgi:hypothetical protein